MNRRLFLQVIGLSALAGILPRLSYVSKAGPLNKEWVRDFSQVVEARHRRRLEEFRFAMDSQPLPIEGRRVYFDGKVYG